MDFPAIRDIAWRSWRAAYGAFLPEDDQQIFFAEWYTLDAHRRALARPDALYLIAERNGVPVAFLLARLEGRRVHLDRLYADPESWRAGAGQRLWDEVVAWARDRGATRIFFEVASQGVAGPAFYRKQGCEERGEITEPIGRTAVRVARYVFEPTRTA